MGVGACQRVRWVGGALIEWLWGGGKTTHPRSQPGRQETNSPQSDCTYTCSLQAGQSMY
eukprot:gene13696-biopygen21591